MQSDSHSLELLDKIHAAILVADFDRLRDLTPALEQSMLQSQQINDQNLLHQIKARAQRNAACLLAAGRGIRAAQQRINELRGARDGFSTYDTRGKRTQHGQMGRIEARF